MFVSDWESLRSFQSARSYEEIRMAFDSKGGDDLIGALDDL